MFHIVDGIIRLTSKKSEPFILEKGVKQGDSLSPLFFIIFMDEVLKTCKARTDKSMVGMRKLRPAFCQVLAYADDIILIADSARKLQQAVIEWGEILKERGMTVNNKKSQIMMVARTKEQVEQINIGG